MLEENAQVAIGYKDSYDKLNSEDKQYFILPYLWFHFMMYNEWNYKEEDNKKIIHLGYILME